MSGPPTMDSLRIHSPASVKEYADCKGTSVGPLSNNSGADGASDSGLQERDSSGASSTTSSNYNISESEACSYYYGIRSSKRRAPKLIFRTSKDIFEIISGPHPYLRPLHLRPVYKHPKLGKDNLWATIRSKIVELLDQRNIQHSSIDLVRFIWIENNFKKENTDTDDEHTAIKILRHWRAVSTPITIWVGVLPDTLTSEVAFHSSNDILHLLQEHGISDIDVAYRESVVRDFSGPTLFAPVSDFSPLQPVIDPVTTALSLPIAGLESLDTQGTMGFYFRVDDDFYAVTARHVLLSEDEGNELYSYVAGPQKKVVVMGTVAFNNFLTSIKTHIRRLNYKVESLERDVTLYTARSRGKSPDANQAGYLADTQCQLSETLAAIPELERFFEEMEQWSDPDDRVIGHVIWAPPISRGAPPHNYTKDICVVKLDKNKFSQNFRNVIDLGIKIGIEFAEFVQSMCPRSGGSQPNFDYPLDRLLKLRGILSAEEMRTPDIKDRNGDPVRHVIKHGLATRITVGCLSGFESHVRRYSSLGVHDSVEAAFCRHSGNSDPFSRDGDSGSIIVDAQGRLVALLTSGTGSTNSIDFDSPDITYGTPMYWLWDVIKAEFPGADPCFEDGDHD